MKSLKTAFVNEREAKERYLAERGGDVATGLLRALHMHEDPDEMRSDVALHYASRQETTRGVHGMDGA
jgi:hypothetical protein